MEIVIFYVTFCGVILTGLAKKRFWQSSCRCRRLSSALASSRGITMMGKLHRIVAVAACSSCFSAAFIGSPLSVIRSGCNRGDSSRHARVSRVSSSERVAASGVQHQMHPGCLHLRTSRRHTRRPLLQSPLRMSSRTVDVDVIDVIDVTEEEARREEEQVCYVQQSGIKSTYHLPGTAVQTA